MGIIYVLKQQGRYSDQLRHTGCAPIVRNQQSFIAFTLHSTVLRWGRGYRLNSLTMISYDSELVGSMINEGGGGSKEMHSKSI